MKNRNGEDFSVYSKDFTEDETETEPFSRSASLSSTMLSPFLPFTFNRDVEQWVSNRKRKNKIKIKIKRKTKKKKKIKSIIKIGKIPSLQKTNRQRVKSPRCCCSPLRK